MKKWMFRVACLLAFAFPAELAMPPSPAQAVVATTKYTLTTSTWTDLGVGPVLVSAAGRVVFAVADTTPSLAAEGMSVLPGSSFTFNTSSHVWAMSIDGISPFVYASPILASGGGGGSLVGGTTPITGTCSPGQFLYNNSGVLGCSTSSATIALPQAVTGGVSGGVAFFSATTTMNSSALLAANALMVGGGAGVAPSTITTGAGVNTVLGVAPNTNGGIGTATTASLISGSIEIGSGSGVAPTGLADVAIGSYLQSGGVTTIPAWQAFGTGAQAAVNAAVNTNGGVATATTTGVVVGALHTGGGSGTGMVGLADVAAGSYLKSGGVTTIPAWQAFGAGVQTGVAAAVNSTTAGALATVVAPLTIGGTGSIATADGYYICTGACTITLPTPAAGYQFCVRNDSTITTVITIAAISTVQFEKTTYNGYGTVTTGTMVSGGALGDKICLIGRDATHYLVGSFVGTWTNS